MNIKFERGELAGYPDFHRVEDFDQSFCCDDMNEFLSDAWLDVIEDNKSVSLKLYIGGAFNFCPTCGEPVTGEIVS